MNDETMIIICKVCNTYVTYQQENISTNDNSKNVIECPVCMNEIEIKNIT